MLVRLLAWGMQVAAITLAPLSLVQAVFAGSVALVAVMADRIFGLPVAGRQWWGLVLTAIGLVLLALTMPAAGSAPPALATAPMVAFEAGLLAVGVLLIVGPHAAGARREHHGIALAAAAGVMFGACNVAVKALTGQFDGVASLASPWLAVALLASAGAFYASARSLQLGGAVAVIGITGTTAAVTCIAGGILIFRDPLPASATGLLLQLLAFVLVLAAAVMVPAPRSAALSQPS
jgi:drug/metabolite transporter (DMT)-like permease